MWKSPRVELKLRLALRVAALAAACFAGVALYALIDTDRAAGSRAAEVAEIAARALALQHAQVGWLTWASTPSTPFPDVPGLAVAFTAPGLCIAYRSASGEIVQRVCNGRAPGAAHVPDSFARLYAAIFDPGREVAHPLDPRDAALGAAVVSLDAEGVIAQAWQDAGGLLAVMAFTLLGLWVLVYVTIALALRPTRAIVAGLERLAAGDLSARMPAFDLADGNIWRANCMTSSANASPRSPRWRHRSAKPPAPNARRSWRNARPSSASPPR
jgi:hypothetical protein